jgi:hypothetical protein
LTLTILSTWQRWAIPCFGILSNSPRIRSLMFRSSWVREFMRFIIAVTPSRMRSLVRTILKLAAPFRFTSDVHEIRVLAAGLIH